MIRHAVENDIPEICRFGINEVQEVGGEMLGWGAHCESIAKNVLGCIEGRVPGVAIVCEIDEKIIGMFIAQFLSQVTDERKWSAREVTWYVLPEYRGNGLGQSMREKAIKCAARKGLQQFWLSVMLRPGHERAVEKMQEGGFYPVSIQMMKNLSEE